MSFKLDTKIKSLKPFLEPDIETDIRDKIELGERLCYYSKDYFIKIAKPKDIVHRASLKNELANLPYTRTLNVKTPELVYCYYDREFFIKVERKIDGQPLAFARNDFKLSVSIEIPSVLVEIAKLRDNVVVDKKIKRDFSNAVKIKRYLQKTEHVLDIDTVNDCRRLAEQLKAFEKNYGRELYLSHGNTLPTNLIASSDGSIYFADWELVGLRGKMYDTVLFLLFSELPHKAVETFFDYIPTNDTHAAFCEAVIIALREIKNWSLAKNGVIAGQFISMWTSALKFSLKQLQA